MKHLFTVLAAATAIFSVSTTAFAGAEIDLSKLPKPSDKKGLTYAADIQPILKASCYGCHGDVARPSGGLRIDSLEAALKGGNDGAVITPGKSETSQIVISVARIDPASAMPRAPRGRRGAPRGADGATNAAAGAPATPAAPTPPAPKNLTPEEVGLVRAWIDQGAK